MKMLNPEKNMFDWAIETDLGVVPYSLEQTVMYSAYTKFAEYALLNNLTLTSLDCNLYRFDFDKVTEWALKEGFLLALNDTWIEGSRGEEKLKISGRLFAKPNCLVYLTDVQVRIFGYSKEMVGETWAALQKLGKLKNSKKLQKFKIITRNQDGFTSTNLGECRDELVVDNYSAEIQAQIPYIKENLASENPRGRLVILRGVPGSGKTTFLKGLAAQTSPEDMQIFLLPPNLIQELNGPDFANFLLEEFRDNDFEDSDGIIKKKKSTVIIIEDGDFCLLDRGADNMGTISSLLNICDGVMGAVLNIKVIVTTNADTQGIDKALLRKGRLLSHLHIDLLPSKEASRIFKRLTGADVDFNGKQTLADVYSAAADYKEKNNVK